MEALPSSLALLRRAAAACRITAPVTTPTAVAGIIKISAYSHRFLGTQNSSAHAAGTPHQSAWERSRCENVLLGTDMRIFPAFPLVVILEPRITYASQHGTLTEAICCTHGSSDVST